MKAESKRWVSWLRIKYLVETSEPRSDRAQIKSENLAYKTWLEIYRENGQTGTRGGRRV